MVSGTISLPCSGYFSPFPHGTGSLSVSQEYLALPDGTGKFTQDFSGPALLRILARKLILLRVPGSHRLNITYRKSYNPHSAVTQWVWAVPRSLATTCRITIVFFSYAYLDVSVQRVCIPCGISRTSPGWVAPFGHLRIESYLHLPAAFRSLSRPSSPLRA
jgi:hypothetical protein